MITLKPLEKFSFNPGRYWVGDPCYVYPDAEWSDFVDLMYDYDEEGGHEVCHLKDGGIATYDNVQFFISNTRWGDGYYPLIQNGQIIGGLGVDAGLLSVIPEELINKWHPSGATLEDHENFAGHWITIESKCSVESTSGNFEFGEFEVFTDGSRDEFSEEDEDED